MANKEDFEKYKELLKENEPGECQVCGSPLTLEKVNLEDYQGGKLYMMENVPAYVCEGCGEVWVPEPIMLEFERMIELVRHRKKEKPAKTTKSTRPKKSKRGKSK
jgi:YgiT-type zinc finger domain-containing protein